MGAEYLRQSVFFGEQDKELNLNKNLTGRKIGMFQMQMEQAEILKSVGKIGGAAYQGCTTHHAKKHRIGGPCSI